MRCEAEMDGMNPTSDQLRHASKVVRALLGPDTHVWTHPGADDVDDDGPIDTGIINRTPLDLARLALRGGIPPVVTQPTSGEGMCMAGDAFGRRSAIPCN